MKNATELRIYVASLADYNNGILHGEWIDIDGKQADEIWEEINQMLASSPYAAKYGEKAEEWAIHDYELGPVRIGEYENIEHLVLLAEGFEMYGEAFLYYVDNVHFSYIESAFNEFSDYYETEAESFKDFAENYFYEVDAHRIPDDLVGFIDLDHYARELEQTFYFTGGYVFRH